MSTVNRAKWLQPLLVMAMVLALSLSTFSWGAGGHMMVARIAYKRLNPNAKAQVDSLVKRKIDPAKITARSLDFINASHWADDLRQEEDFDFLKELHFIDQPFTTDDSQLPTDLPGDKTIVSALNDNLQTLKTSTDDDDRAMALRLIIHFVGDIHQPLHCATRVTEDLPEGDKGGNLFNIKLRDANDKLKRSNLHSYWDGGIGSFPKTGANFAPPSLRKVAAAATKIIQKFPADSEAWHDGGTMGFQQWATESKELAINTAYKNIREQRVPNNRYNQAALRVAERRVAWAGYRLAELLNSIWPE